MKLRHLLLAVAATALGPSLQVGAADVPIPPVEEKTSSVRGEMNLNGEWDFAPASSKQPPKDGWGRIMVPGGWSVVPSWTGVQLMVGGIVKAPAEPITDDLASGWYARTLEIPQSWVGRAV